MPGRPKPVARRRRPRPPRQQQLLPPPRHYDESDGWRRTVLYRVTKPLERDALIRLSKMLDRLLVEAGDFWRELEEPSPEIELRAAATDLIHVAEFLRRLESEQEYDGFDEEERAKLRLCRLATRQAIKVLRIAEALGAALPPKQAEDA